MKILLDTHILLWHLTDNPKLSQNRSQLQCPIEIIVPREIIILDIKLHVKLV